MPVFKEKKLNDKLNYILWEITEPLEELRLNLNLSAADLLRLSGFSHIQKQREFLAIRQCLKTYFGYCPDVMYTRNGKPLLKSEGLDVSFSHTRNYAAVLIGENTPFIGIDIETPRKTIERIASKFMREEEKETLSEVNTINHLLQYWGSKEVIVKIEDNKRLGFKSEIHVEPFIYEPFTSTNAILKQQGSIEKYYIGFEEHSPLILTYGWKIDE